MWPSGIMLVIFIKEERSQVSKIVPSRGLTREVDRGRQTNEQNNRIEIYVTFLWAYLGECYSLRLTVRSRRSDSRSPTI
ncbi:hypothetical protein HU200_023012 [Digitaria exilis]|uniref:Uncharacterized protein n=1 Tax=Digitaria exilis TaxID=1010633 RepID=A0A835CD58_9POAL|nr:hypothetical protein HU200_023012 [Digitaria exilis]